MFNSADHSMYMTTPYFFPDRHIRHLLKMAARHGVDVRLLVPRKNDVRLARWAAQAVYEELLLSGVRIYEYLPRLLHAKTVVIDGNFATVGTANLDYRSFFLNYELNFFSRGPAFCQSLQKQYETDLRDSEEIKMRQWVRRPLAGRALELIAWMVRRWL
jgi:cardiolipin synthase